MADRTLWDRARGYYSRRSASFVFQKPFKIVSQRPIISFTFDDFPESALSSGGAILNRAGAAGTYYTALGLMGRDQPSGRMFRHSDLQAALDGGHELGCHTYEHYNSWETRPHVFETSVIDNSAALQRLLPGAVFRTFSYPIGPPRPFTKARVAKHFLCGRAGGQTFNVGRSDLNQLSAYFLEKSRDDVLAVRDVIDRNAQGRGWLIFATHDVAECPTAFGCTPSFFEEVVAYSVRSGARVLPVVNALEALGAPLTI